MLLDSAMANSAFNNLLPMAELVTFWRATSPCRPVFSPDFLYIDFPIMTVFLLLFYMTGSTGTFFRDRSLKECSSWRSKLYLSNSDTSSSLLLSDDMNEESLDEAKSLSSSIYTSSSSALITGEMLGGSGALLMTVLNTFLKTELFSPEIIRT